MPASRLAALSLFALPALAQFVPIPNATAPVNQFTFPGQPRFDLSADGGGPTQLGAGSSVVSRNRGGPVTVAHRYFYDPAAHTYFGYDVVIQPDHDETYKVSFYDLSIGPLDFKPPARHSQPRALEEAPNPPLCLPRASSKPATPS